MVMCPCSDKCTTLGEDTDHGGSHVCKKFLYFPLNYAVNLKLL